MVVIPTIRASREDAPATSGTTQTRWEGTYEDYLQSPQWRTTRNGALRRASYHCSRCPSTRPLQVHHKTYVRLGCELPEDLEVLCLTCHQGHHIDEDKLVHGVYVRLVSEVLRHGRFTNMADLMDATKSECAKLKIRYDGRLVGRAVELVDANRKGVLDAPRIQLPEKPVVDGLMRKISHDDARRMLTALNVTVAGREMGRIVETRDDVLGDHERANQIRQLARQAS